MVQLVSILLTLLIISLTNPEAFSSTTYEYIPTYGGNESGFIEVDINPADVPYVINYDDFISFDFSIPDLSIQFDLEDLFHGEISSGDYEDIQGGYLQAQMELDSGTATLVLHFASTSSGQRDQFNLSIDDVWEADGYGDWVPSGGSPIPLPASALLLSSGVFGLYALRKRFR